MWLLLAAALQGSAPGLTPRRVPGKGSARHPHGTPPRGSSEGRRGTGRQSSDCGSAAQGKARRYAPPAGAGPRARGRCRRGAERGGCGCHVPAPPRAASASAPTRRKKNNKKKLTGVTSVCAIAEGGVGAHCDLSFSRKLGEKIVQCRGRRRVGNSYNLEEAQNVSETPSVLWGPSGRCCGATPGPRPSLFWQSFALGATPDRNLTQLNSQTPSTTNSHAAHLYISV